MATTTMYPAVLLAALLFYVFYQRLTKPRPPAPLPPGPRPLPILGNITDLTQKELWLTAERLGHQYGRITYVHVLGQGIVFLNTAEVAFELLDKRGAIYSDRPRLIMAGELCGCNNMVPFTPYGDRSRRHRKLMQAALGASSILDYRPWLKRETKPLLRGLLEDPLRFQDHFRRYAGGLTLSVVYGYHVKSADDFFLKLADECVSLLFDRIVSGSGLWPVDIVPLLNYLPVWFPGAGFKRKAAVWRKKIEEFVDKPYAFLLNERRKGTAKASFVSKILDAKEDQLDAQHEFDLKWTASSVYGGSVDTTLATLANFVLAMVQYPAVLKRAQAEIDATIGQDRLPDFEDRPSLPYCDAVFTEILRWAVPVPTTIPHRLMEDDIYDGFFLPKGTQVFANMWSILRDEKLYPDPETFNPDRFFEPADDASARRDPRLYVFGFGRRRCPGLHLVESSIWLVIVSMMATLNIGKAVDERGVEVEPEVKFDNAAFRLPNSFKLVITARSEKVLQLLAQEMGSTKIPL